MSNLIMTNKGEPFATSAAVMSRKAGLSSQGIEAEVVEVEGGFALRETSRREIEMPVAEQPVRETPKIVEGKPGTPPKPRKRVPLGRRNILKYPDRPGYKRRVVNDLDDRVLIFQQAGWEPVSQEDLLDQDARIGASRMGLTARKPVGGGVHGVLMEIPEEYYLEDQKAKQDEIKRLEDDMRRNRGGVEGAYGSIDIK